MPDIMRRKRMKRRDFLTAGGAGLAASVVAAPAIAQSMPEVKWRYATSWPKSLDTLYGGGGIFFKRVAANTHKPFPIQSFLGGGGGARAPGGCSGGHGTPGEGDNPPAFYFCKKPP